LGKSWHAGGWYLGRSTFKNAQEGLPQALPGAAPEPWLSPFAALAGHEGAASGVEAALNGGDDVSRGLQQGRHGRAGDGHGRTGEGHGRRERGRGGLRRW
jgi:hypothetical protein